MRVTRLYVNQSLSLNYELKLDDATCHYAVNVLRLNKSSSLELFNGDGYNYSCEILVFSKKAIEVNITGQLRAGNESPLITNIILGASKRSHMDYAIQKTVEAGVTNIYPIITKRSVTKLTSKSITNKHQHWQKIIISACEQCGRATLPSLHATTDIADLNQLAKDEHGFVLDADANQPLTHFNKDCPTRVWLLIGPEGGLTPLEISALISKGYQAVTLGPRVLRTETAALSAIVGVQLLWGDGSA